jgi:hypothetical protein
MFIDLFDQSKAVAIAVFESQQVTAHQENCKQTSFGMYKSEKDMRCFSLSFVIDDYG